MSLEKKPERALEIFTVYFNPLDYPGLYVVRVFWNATPTVYGWTAPTLEEVRARLPRGLVCLPREPGDEPQIVECWL